MRLSKIKRNIHASTIWIYTYINSFKIDLNRDRNVMKKGRYRTRYFFEGIVWMLSLIGVHKYYYISYKNYLFSVSESRNDIRL